MARQNQAPVLTLIGIQLDAFHYIIMHVLNNPNQHLIFLLRISHEFSNRLIGNPYIPLQFPPRLMAHIQNPRNTNSLKMCRHFRTKICRYNPTPLVIDLTPGPGDRVWMTGLVEFCGQVLNNPTFRNCRHLSTITANAKPFQTGTWALLETLAIVPRYGDKFSWMLTEAQVKDQYPLLRFLTIKLLKEETVPFSTFMLPDPLVPRLESLSIFPIAPASICTTLAAGTNLRNFCFSLAERGRLEISTMHHETLVTLKIFNAHGALASIDLQMPGLEELWSSVPTIEFLRNTGHKLKRLVMLTPVNLSLLFPILQKHCTVLDELVIPPMKSHEETFPRFLAQADFCPLLRFVRIVRLARNMEELCISGLSLWEPALLEQRVVDLKQKK